VWGLNGLAALDPDLNATLQDNQIRLYGPDQLLIAVPAPAPGDAAAWGKAAAAVASAAFAASPALQAAGTQGVVESFFDELFNHFDPYSRYEPPVQAAQEQLMVTGIAGTGFLLRRQGNEVVVDSVSADNLNGILGSKITLNVRQPDDPPGTVSEIVLTRAFVPPQTVFPEVFSPEETFLALKITAFNKGTSDQFSAALVAGLGASPPPSGLVIDLRGNRGGVLRQAVLIADSLLPAGLIAEAAGRDPDAAQKFTAEGSDLTGGLPMVVLVDGQTASAAEILSAALADDRRAVVVGSSTLGKGLVQTVTALPDGGELFITWSRVLAPRGWPLQTLGVVPQVCTSLGELALDSQLAALAQGKNLMRPVLAASRAARASLGVNDILNIRNQCPAAIGGDLDVMAARALLESPRAYQAALLP
jgi:carboxyl-terminal processing protease